MMDPGNHEVTLVIRHSSFDGGCLSDDGTIPTLSSLQRDGSLSCLQGDRAPWTPKRETMHVLLSPWKREMSELPGPGEFRSGRSSGSPAVIRTTSGKGRVTTFVPETKCRPRRGSRSG